jgi:uncharacterized alkaline shock family protein YloU
VGEHRHVGGGDSQPEPERADVVAAAVRSVAGVAGLHPGMFGEVGTYLPGRRVPGIRIEGDVTEVHVTLFFGAAVRETAARVRDVVAGVVGGTVNVTVEDVVSPATDSGGMAGGGSRDEFGR